MKTTLLVLLTVAACGSDGDTGPDDNVTFDALPEATRQQFVAWKARPIKDCAWEQAFPSIADQADLPYTPSSRVDYQALLAANDGSPLLVGAAGELAIIGPGGPDSLLSEHTYKTNGLDVRSTLQGGVCVVSLGGEELFRAELPAVVPVYASFQSGKLGAAGSDLTAMRAATFDGHEIAAIDSAPLMRHALAALAPTHDIDGFLATRFDISASVAAALFLPVSRDGARPPNAVRFVGLAEVTPFTPGQQIYGPTEVLRPLYDGDAFRLELLFRVPDDASQSVALRADLVTAAGGKAVKATAITAAPSVPNSDAAFLACFAQRHQAAAFDTAQLRSPGFDEQFYGCEGLTGDGLTALADDATQRAEVIRQAMTINRGPYRGWDGALIAIAQRLNARGIELSVLGSDPAITEILARWSALRTAIADATVRTVFDPPLIELTFAWWFQALQPSDAFVASISTALANAATRFPASATAMLRDVELDLDPSGAGGQAVTCGVGFAGERVTAVDRAIAAVAAVPYSEVFLDGFRASFLQDCPASATLGSLDPASKAVSAFVTGELARDHSSIVFESAIRGVVDHALTERWTTDTFAALADVAAFGRASKLQCNAPTLSAQAICIDSSLAALSAAPGKMLAPATAARYAELARTLTDRWPALSDAGAIDVQFDVTDAFFAGMWLGCSDAGFARSRGQLLDLFARLPNATLDRFELADQISTLVSSSTCS